MKKYILLILILISALSCSRINQRSREYYESQHESQHMRHGVVPLSGTVVQKLDEASKTRGKALYEEHCLACHGEKGEGNGPEAQKHTPRPANLRKLAQEVPNFKFYISISQWQGGMPGWKEPFSELDREDLTTYIKTFR